MKSKTLIVVCGPTASGKTKLAITLAKHFGAEIFSADARQFFREMNIGTAKPTATELAEVPHHFISNKSISESYTAGVFEKDAIKALTDYFSKSDVAILCGGSGLYIRAVTEGLEEKTAVKEETKIEVAQMSLEAMQQKLRELDEEYYETVDIHNPRRLSRALELIMSSGKKMNELNTGSKKQREFQTIYIGTDLPREELYENINRRVDEMIASGLKEEALQLYPFRENIALQTVGYKEWFDFFEGNTNEQEAIALIKQNTRNYAKRQLTWFRKVENVNWFNPKEAQSIIRFLEEKINL